MCTRIDERPPLFRGVDPALFGRLSPRLADLIRACRVCGLWPMGEPHETLIRDAGQALENAVASLALAAELLGELAVEPGLPEPLRARVRALGARVAIGLFSEPTTETRPDAIWLLYAERVPNPLVVLGDEVVRPAAALWWRPLWEQASAAAQSEVDALAAGATEPRRSLLVAGLLVGLVPALRAMGAPRTGAEHLAQGPADDPEAPFWQWLALARWQQDPLLHPLTGHGGPMHVAVVDGAPALRCPRGCCTQRWDEVPEPVAESVGTLRAVLGRPDGSHGDQLPDDDTAEGPAAAPDAD